MSWVRHLLWRALVLAAGSLLVAANGSADLPVTECCDYDANGDTVFDTEDANFCIACFPYCTECLNWDLNQDGMLSAPELVAISGGCTGPYTGCGAPSVPSLTRTGGVIAAAALLAIGTIVPIALARWRRRD